MVWAVNNLTLVGVPDSIMESVSGVRDSNGEVVSGSNGDNQT